MGNLKVTRKFLIRLKQDMFIKLINYIIQMFIVIGTDTYLKEIDKWTKQDKEAALKIPNQLKENPLVGKPLGYPFLREKKINEKRVYYLIYNHINLVLLVATSGKKDQQITIDHIKKNLHEFKKVAEIIAKQAS